MDRKSPHRTLPPRFIRTWHSRWFSVKELPELLHEDLALRKELKGGFRTLALGNHIERFANKLKSTSRPRVPESSSGSEGQRSTARDELQKRMKGEVHINIIEIQPGDRRTAGVRIDRAAARARSSFRRAMKKGFESAFRFGAQGIKIRCAGRLNGAEIARSEWYQEGRLPLHTLKADIDYGFAEANTTYGKIGVKVWIYRGEQHKAKNRRKTA